MFPLVMPPRYNYVNAFVVHLFKFESEKTQLWFLFRMLYTIVVCADAFISMGTILLHAFLAALIAHLHTSWLSYFVKVTYSLGSVRKLLGFYNVVTVLNITCQSVTRSLAPLFLGSSFVVTIICNLIALKMFHEMDTLIYVICVVGGLLFFVVTTTVIQFAAKSVRNSANCIKKFENVIIGRKTKRIRRKLKCLRPIGFEMGAFYLISMNMVLMYGYHMMEKTMSLMFLI